MEAPLDTRPQLPNWLSTLLILMGWLILLMTAILSGLGRSSLAILGGGGFLLVLFAAILQWEIRDNNNPANVTQVGVKSRLRKLSTHVGLFIGAGLVLLVQYLARTLIGVAQQ